jgi:hypothetical protein
MLARIAAARVPGLHPVTRHPRTGQALRARLAPAALLLVVIVGAGCGSSKKAASSPLVTTTTRSQSTTTTGPSALQGEAASAATGDIPDNQVYVRFTNAAARYSIKYPEGWAQSGSGPVISFRDKNNIARIVVASGPAATAASARKDLTTLRKSNSSLRFKSPQALTISGAPAIKVVYTTESAPNPVTNKRVELTVDRYYIESHGNRAVVDLGTPVGVDNVDAYRLMIESFRWR